MSKSKLLTVFSVSILVLALAAFIGLVIVLPSLESIGEANQAMATVSATASEFTPVLEVYSPYPNLSPITAENAAQITQLDTIPRYFGGVSDLDFSPSQELLAITDWQLTLWDLRNQTAVGDMQWVTQSAFSPDGRRVVVTADYVDVHDPVAGTVSRRMEGRSSLGFTGLALTNDGSRLVTGSATTSWTSNYGLIQLWDFQTGDLLYSVSQGASVYQVDISPDGTLVASGDKTPVIRLWDAQLEPLAELKGHGLTTSLTFSPDGSLLASADRVSIRLWDLSSRMEKLTLEGHREMITQIAFSPDGSLLASVSKDSTLRLWEVATGRALAVLALSPLDEKGSFPLVALQDGDDSTTMPSSSRTWLTAVTFSPDGSLLVATNGLEMSKVYLLGVPLTD